MQLGLGISHAILQAIMGKMGWQYGMGYYKQFWREIFRACLGRWYAIGARDIACNITGDYGENELAIWHGILQAILEASAEEIFRARLGRWHAMGARDIACNITGDFGENGKQMFRARYQNSRQNF